MCYLSFYLKSIFKCHGVQSDLGIVKCIADALFDPEFKRELRDIYPHKTFLYIYLFLMIKKCCFCFLSIVFWTNKYLLISEIKKL